jgi:hypothetical protein
MKNFEKSYQKNEKKFVEKKLPTKKSEVINNKKLRKSTMKRKFFGVFNWFD